MKKIDILNFITNFRKAPNDSKTYSELVQYVGTLKEPELKEFLEELKQTRVIKEFESKGERCYQVVAK